MVVQRDEPIRVWGMGKPGEKVSVSFFNHTSSATIANDSSWSVSLSQQPATAVNHTMFIYSGHDTLELYNIVVGDVWIASGQSNMEWPMMREMHWKEEIRHTTQPLIRINNPVPVGRNVYGVAYTDSLNWRLTKDSFYLWATWQTCDSNTIRHMSAVGYYFAKAIVNSKNIPVGIINLSIGGAPIETFISRDKLATHKKFSSKVSGNWLENKHLPAWVKERGKQNIANSPNGYGDDLGLNHAYKPGFAYAGGIEPLVPFPIKGFIWYQGESNSLERSRVDEYRELQSLMIEDYRSKWRKPRMPFFWVQLSSIDTAKYQSRLWPEFRNEQRLLMDEIKYSGMAVSSDIGFRNDVHPTNKKDVGERLARWALYSVYDKKIIPSGPLPLNAVYRNGMIEIHFRWARTLKTQDGEAVRGFSFDGVEDVTAKVRGNTIVIETKKKPDYLYYGWKPYSDGNLVNEEGLPASTFRIPVTYNK